MADRRASDSHRVCDPWSADGLTYIVVVGSSGSGKTFLAEQLSRRLGWVLLSKDRLKESLADSLGLGDEDWSLQLSGAAMGLLYRTAATASDAVLDSNFHGEFDTRRLLSLPGQKLQIFCRADPEVIRARVLHRVRSGERHPIHRDVINPRLAAAIGDGSEAIVPLDLGCPILRLDTTGGTDVDEVLNWLRRHGP